MTVKSFSADPEPIHLSVNIQRQLQSLHNSIELCRRLEPVMRGCFANELLRVFRAKETTTVEGGG